MEVAKQQENVKDVLKSSTSIVLMDFEETKENLKEIVSKYDHIQEVTKENFEVAKESRAQIREARYKIQNVTDHNKKILNTAKKDLESNAKELIEIIEPTENRLDAGIKSIENEKKLEKERKEREEQERINKISSEIARFKSELEVIVRVGTTNEDLDKFNSILDELKSKMNDGFFAEFNFEAEDIESDFINKIEIIQARILEREEVEKQRLENERIQKQRAERSESLKPFMFFVGADYERIVSLDDESFSSEISRLENEKSKFEAEQKAQKEREEKQRLEDEKRAKQQQEEIENARKIVYESRKTVLESLGFILDGETFFHSESASEIEEKCLSLQQDEFSSILESAKKHTEETRQIKAEKEEKQKRIAEITAKMLENGFVHNSSNFILRESYKGSVLETVWQDSFVFAYKNIDELIQKAKEEIENSRKRIDLKELEDKKLQEFKEHVKSSVLPSVSVSIEKIKNQLDSIVDSFNSLDGEYSESFKNKAESFKNDMLSSIEIFLSKF
jgi:hypothetical protein